MNDDHEVVTTQYSWLELCESVDKLVGSDNDLRPVVYEFGGGRMKKRDGLGPYGPPADLP